MSSALDTIGAAWRELRYSERRALLVLAYCAEEHAEREWRALPEAVREKLVLAFRAAIELGTECALALSAASRRA